jgi:hypothetical protein
VKGDRPGKAPGKERRKNRPHNIANSQKNQSARCYQGTQKRERVEKRNKDQKIGQAIASDRAIAS